MPGISDKRDVILDAARNTFSQYGFRKTSMADIAREAGISRPSLYSYFENKEEIFRSLSQHLNEKALTGARVALHDNRDHLAIAEKVMSAVLAFNVSLYRLLDESPHGSELMDESSRLCGDLASGYYAEFEALLKEEIEFAANAAELDLARAGVSASEAAAVLRYAIGGLKSGAGSADQFETRARQFIRVYFSGLS